MCGVSGIVSKKEDLLPRILKAERVQLHRGPDAQGVHRAEINGWNIYLGHQRLSILDLTPTGNQPMSSEDENLWITYNGEVYNFVEIRGELEKFGRCFRSSSDTEVVLAAIQHWGIEEALKRFNGMWAFVLLDVRNRKLVLARDRMGVKPLYVRFDGDDFCFSSEIKALAEMSSGRLCLNRAAVGQYLMQSLLDATDATFFEEINKVPPAHYGIVDLSKDRLRLDLHRYWRVPQEECEVTSEKALAEEVRDLFFDSVRLRLRSDVPVGILVSGGIDSSAIAAAMQRILGRGADLNLIAMVSDDPRYDESPFIDSLSKHLRIGVHKVRLNLGPGQAISQLETVCWHNDEPVGSFGNVAHHLLMKKAEELGVTVVLSGQGGDELLCGYKKYLGFYLHSLMERRRYLGAARVAWGFLNRGTIIRQFTMSEAKRYLPCYLKQSEQDICGPALKDYVRIKIGMGAGMTMQERQTRDIENYSIPALVHSEDRMSMSCSREIRLPFLDYRLVEKIVALPESLKIRDGWTKYIFRKATESMLPHEIAWRKCKQGFDNPQREWLKGVLRNAVTSYFSDAESMIFKYGLIDRRKLMSKYDRFCVQKSRLGIVSFKDIFSPLALEVWLRRYRCYL